MNNFLKERKFPRRVFNREVLLLHKGRAEICMSNALGEGGMGLMTQVEMIMGDFVVLSFVIPDCGYLILTGVVRQFEPQANGYNQIGFQFENISFENKREIRDFVARRSEKESETEKTSFVA